MGHFHDGNVLAVPREDDDKVKSSFNHHVKAFGQELHLQYDQTVKVKNVWS